MSGRALLIHAEALAEAEAARAWYAERSTRAAEAFLQQLDRVLDLILEAPSRWPVYWRDIRRIPLRTFPFLVIYRERPGEVQILAIAHGRRKPGYWKDRTK